MRPRYSILHVAANLSRLRDELELTQAAIAGDVRVAKMSVSRWERGVQTPSLSKLVLLAEALGVTPNCLLESPE